MRGLVVMALAAWLAATCSPAQAGTPLPSCAVPGYQQVYVPGPGVFSGGLQSETDLQRLHEQMGVQHIIDLRPADAEGAEPESAIAQRLGVSYQRIAIADRTDLTPEHARMLHRALQDHAGEPVLVHCVTGKRAAALLTLRAVWEQGQPPDDAIAHGRRMGLDTAEPMVADLLGLPVAQAATAVAAH